MSEIFEHYTTIITLENGVVSGGFGSSILEYLTTTKYTNTVKILGVKDEFPEHGSVHQLEDLHGISPQKIKQTILYLLHIKKKALIMKGSFFNVCVDTYFIINLVVFVDPSCAVTWTK